MLLEKKGSGADADSEYVVRGVAEEWGDVVDDVVEEGHGEGAEGRDGGDDGKWRK